MAKKLSILFLLIFAGVLLWAGQANVTIAKTLVTTAGTPVVAGTSDVRFRAVVFQAFSTNTGKVYVQTVSTSTTNRFSIPAGNSLSLTVPNGIDWLCATNFYLDADVNTEGAIISYFH